MWLSRPLVAFIGMLNIEKISDLEHDVSFSVPSVDVHVFASLSSSLAASGSCKDIVHTRFHTHFAEQLCNGPR